MGDELASRLEVYFRLLEKWNLKINLSGLDLAESTTEAIDRLLIEPLAAARFVRPGAARGIDIGSGGGSPAIPMALALPAFSVVMVEAKTRKSVFLREAIRVLGLESSTVVNARFEELLSIPVLHEAHDLLTVRAVRVETRILLILQDFLRHDGEMFLFRSSPLGNAMIPHPLVWKEAHELLDSQSRLEILRKV
jgi:16S rRNA (guanine527-N7)-methyltransferase